MGNQVSTLRDLVSAFRPLPFPPSFSIQPLAFVDALVCSPPREAKGLLRGLPHGETLRGYAARANEKFDLSLAYRCSGLDPDKIKIVEGAST